jgi:hypothetical protein
MTARGRAWPIVLIAAVVAGATAAVVVAALVVTGGSAASNPPPEPPTEAEMESIMEAHVEGVAADGAVTHPEIWRKVGFERFVTPDEAPGVINECIRGFGVTTVEISVNGSFSGTLEEYERAVVDACSLSYPYEFMKAGIQTDAQLEYSYNYATTFLIPCLRAAGYAIDQAPTRESYLSSAHDYLQGWSPYDGFKFASDRRWSNYRFDSPELALGLEQLGQRCPATPEGTKPEY